MGRAYSMLGKMRNIYRMLIRKAKVKKSPGRLVHNWEDNIKLNLKGTGSEDVDWIHLAQDRIQ
jgi:hypothetical protein